MQRGKFITVEGIEGVGKSTNIAALVGLVEGHGHTVVQGREPGGTPMAENIRTLLLTFFLVSVLLGSLTIEKCAKDNACLPSAK